MRGADWRPDRDHAALRRRAALLAAHAAKFFAERGVIEVETPMVSAAGPERSADRMPGHPGHRQVRPALS